MYNQIENFESLIDKKMQLILESDKQIKIH